MSKKNQYISIRISDEERSHLEAIKGRYSISHAIRQLIREKPLGTLKTATKANKELPLRQQELLLSKWVESLA
tara:strand:- start:322 stop:540 length:219 start_codon:yes stop_codon:yes gene_type:complete